MSDSPVHLPDSIRRLLWEFDEGAVSWEHHRDFIVERVLARGDWDSIRWVRQRIGDKALREMVRRSRGRALSRAQIRFWQLILDLPEAEVEQWPAAPSRRIWDQRTA